jgi:hypothetical protein
LATHTTPYLRDKTKIALKNLKIVIIDEISMVKADMLYQLDIKLQEIKEKPGVPFGGVMIACFGDIFQLKPVLGHYVFTKPQNAAFHITFLLDSRWEMLRVLNLTTNHRQGKDRSFADLLNRIRFVEKGAMLPEDIETLESRVRPIGHPDLQAASINVVCKLRQSALMNDAYLDSLAGNSTMIKAVNYTTNKKHFKPRINDKDGSIGQTGYLDELKLKRGAKVMLVWNVDTTDYLTNGQTGTLEDIIQDDSGSVRYLMIRFNRESAGRQARTKLPQLAVSHPGCTRIDRHMNTYSLSQKGSGATATVIQFPIRLAHAVTAHKTQGLTIHQPNTVNLDLISIFEPAQGYVMLGRAQALDQVFIQDQLKPDKIWASPQALAECELMNARSINNEKTGWYPDQSNTIKIAALNVARLRPHMADLWEDPTLLKADLIHLCETWVRPDDNLEQFNMPGYTAQFLNVGDGKGIVTYFTKMFVHQDDVIADGYQATRFSSDNIDSIHVYRSQNGSIDDLIHTFNNMIQGSRTTLITGDFNICLRKTPNNRLSTFLQGLGFNQLNSQPTHIEGGQIDHVYLRDTGSIFKAPCVLRYSPYYSDHDGLCTALTMSQVRVNISIPQ